MLFLFLMLFSMALNKVSQEFSTDGELALVRLSLHGPTVSTTSFSVQLINHSYFPMDFTAMLTWHPLAW